MSSDEEGRRRLDNPGDFVRLEIGTALKRGIRVIPVLVDGASMPPSGQLPEDLKPLALRNALNVSHERFRADAERLIGSVGRALESARVEQQRKREEYDIALSFAGEDRAYVEQVAHLLRDQGVKVFYDLFEEANLWGKDLYAHFADVYQHRARFTVIFISAAYAKKLWVTHERRAAQARAFQEAGEYILPVRFDDTEIPGVLPTTGYVSVSGRTPKDLVAIIVHKLVSIGGSVPTELVRKDYSTVATVRKTDPSILAVSVADDQGNPIPGCTVTAQADNGTTIDGISGADGIASLTISTRRTYRLLIAHPDYPATMVQKVDPIENVQVTLPRAEKVGSLIIHSTGYIPGLAGRLSPILDTINRTYLYADNIAINGGKNQPENFAINEPIELEDANGVIVFATVKHIFGHVTLLQYTRPT
jgi:hypothetical protein